MREPMPAERRSITHEYTILAPDGLYEGLITVGLYPDGRPGELFLRLAPVGHSAPSCGVCNQPAPTVLQGHADPGGWADMVAIAASLALQAGCPLDKLCEKYIAQRFEPAGVTNHPEVVRLAMSPLDYVFRWLRWKFVPQPSAVPLPEVPQQP